MAYWSCPLRAVMIITPSTLTAVPPTALYNLALPVLEKFLSATMTPTRPSSTPTRQSWTKACLATLSPWISSFLPRLLFSSNPTFSGMIFCQRPISPFFGWIPPSPLTPMVLYLYPTSCWLISRIKPWSSTLIFQPSSPTPPFSLTLPIPHFPLWWALAPKPWWAVATAIQSTQPQQVATRSAEMAWCSTTPAMMET